VALGLIIPGPQTGAAYSDVGLWRAWPFITYIAVQLTLGLRDKVTFLAARPEQYSVALLAFGVLTSYAGGVVDMVGVTKIAMFAVWWGAFISKIGMHLTLTAPAMRHTAPLHP